MERFLALLYQGITDGVVAALAAVGLVVLSKATGIINFAHGDLITLGAYVGLWLMNDHGWGYFPAVAGTTAVMFAAGVVMERATVAPLRGKSIHVVVITTLGLALAIRSLISIWRGNDLHRMETPLDGFVTIGARLSHHRVFVVVAALAVLIAVMLFFAKTSWGRQLRAVAADRPMAQLSGVRAAGMSMAAFGFSAALAGLCGILIGPLKPMDTLFGFEVMLNSFAAMVIGGQGSIGGVIIAGLAIGLVERVLGNYIADGQYSSAFPFVFMILAIALRPQGLFGKREHASRL